MKTQTKNTDCVACFISLKTFLSCKMSPTKKLKAKHFTCPLVASQISVLEQIEKVVYLRSDVNHIPYFTPKKITASLL